MVLKYNYNLRIIVTIALFIFIFGSLLEKANGHGFGLSIEKTVGEYLIDVDANKLVLRAGEQIRFDFRIVNKDDITKSPEFTDAWVRISPNNSRDTIFAGNLHKPELGTVGMTHTFPSGGDYELTIRFQNDGEKVGEDALFPLTVEDSDKINKNWPNVFLPAFLSGAVVGGALYHFYSRKRLNSSKQTDQ